ncbi:enoyl-CoA hydratase/isomerase family protein [Corynebacterium lizhenjunii]|uniref:3-hydroxyisobutyryl-CoA hydrolase n=1 Tax=Corynebacterium lizhenjunii TaxID=2709394 RepID=A0A7T0KHK4_9CORY|nr:3-hydroxyisobutyryl-CoA hydrolase [Corynebacterium lizhenjunii]QPK79833.1 enoyl-CoA hydratase/isomerase family protein [Corynebacterium lizhenjunii]
MTENSLVLAEVRGRVGILTLNRPKALNALNLEMIRQLHSQLRAWAEDPAVELVILRGAGERGLCAGGDIATLYQDALDGGTAGATFWKEEYELDHYISVYPKPYVAIMNGIVLGGGIGVSAHASHRVVTDDSRIGMPEVGIGYSPDAGGSYLLAAVPDRLGRHLAYTAAHVGAAEAIDTGFADYYVPQDQLDGLVEYLAGTGEAGGIGKFSADCGPAFGADRAEMVDIYAAATVGETLQRLEASESEWAAKAAKAIRRHSPLGLAVTQYALDNPPATLAQGLEREFWMSLNMQRHPEFAEGIRAQIIDKDRNPQWSYASVDTVPAEVVEAIFAPLDGFEPPHFAD